MAELEDRPKPVLTRHKTRTGRADRWVPVEIAIPNHLITWVGMSLISYMSHGYITQYQNRLLCGSYPSVKLIAIKIQDQKKNAQFMTSLSQGWKRMATPQSIVSLVGIQKKKTMCQVWMRCPMRAGVDKWISHWISNKKESSFIREFGFHHI